MEKIFENTLFSIKHLEILHKTFLDKNNFSNSSDWILYNNNCKKLLDILSKTTFYEQLYGEKGRQMILADIFEYIFLGRGYYFAIKDREKIKELLEIILRFVNLLMSYETITIDKELRKRFLDSLRKTIPNVKNEPLFETLLEFEGKVGLTEKESDADKELNKYFDTILPKTAGGLWHELLVYAFLVRHDLGYVVPLLLSQRLLSGSGAIVPPDFLIITKDKNIYGIEVGIKKEIQSGSFSLLTNIPTATIDTINSRSSDRCPICKKWIMFCDQVVKDFSDLNNNIGTKSEIRCLEECKIFKKREILAGKCPYTKYSRNKTKTLKHTQHEFADGLHYHYQCILTKLSKEKVKQIRDSNDIIAFKTHYPYYAGLEMLFK